MDQVRLDNFLINSEKNDRYLFGLSDCRILDDMEMYEQQDPFKLTDFVAMSYFLNQFLYKAVLINLFGESANPSISYIRQVDEYSLNLKLTGLRYLLHDVLVIRIYYANLSYNIFYSEPSNSRESINSILPLKQFKKL